MLTAESLMLFPKIPSYMFMWFHLFLLRSYFIRKGQKVLELFTSVLKTSDTQKAPSLCFYSLQVTGFIISSHFP